MKKLPIILLFALIALADYWIAIFDARAEVAWNVKKQLRLKAKPLAVAASMDGQYFYILFEGKLLIYSLMEGKGKYTIPVDKSLDMLTLSAAHKLLILTSSSKQIVRFIELEFTQQLDMSELPYKGPQNAPVTITAFGDYQ